MYQMTRPPYISAGLALGLGYFAAMFSRAERVVTPDIVKFQGRDQMRRLREFIRVRVGLHP
jgi:hypothetical protein